MKIMELPKKLSKYACNNITPVFSAEQQAVALKFPDLVTRNGQSKSHVARSTFKDDYTVRHQKGRRIPVHLQDEVSSELKRLQQIGHIEKLKSCSDKFFTSSIVITVKKDKSIKLALDSKVLNTAIHKNKYQMPNIETLMDSVGETLTDPSTVHMEPWFSSIDLK